MEKVLLLCILLSLGAGSHGLKIVSEQTIRQMSAKYAKTPEALRVLDMAWNATEDKFEADFRKLVDLSFKASSNSEWGMKKEAGAYDFSSDAKDLLEETDTWTYVRNMVKEQLHPTAEYLPPKENTEGSAEYLAALGRPSSWFWSLVVNFHKKVYDIDLDARAKARMTDLRAKTVSMKQAAEGQSLWKPFERLVTGKGSELLQTSKGDGNETELDGRFFTFCSCVFTDGASDGFRCLKNARYTLESLDD